MGWGSPPLSHPTASVPGFDLSGQCVASKKDQLEGGGEQRTLLNPLAKISTNYLVTFWSL